MDTINTISITIHFIVITGYAINYIQWRNTKLQYSLLEAICWSSFCYAIVLCAPILTLIGLDITVISASLYLYLRYDEICRLGLLSYLPVGVQTMLLQETLLNWITDTSFSRKLKQYFPLLLGLNNTELKSFLSHAPSEFRHNLTRKGLIHALPTSLQEFLLPSNMIHTTSDLEMEDLIETPISSTSSDTSIKDSPCTFHDRSTELLQAIEDPHQWVEGVAERIVYRRINQSVMNVLQKLQSPEMRKYTVLLTAILFAKFILWRGGRRLALQEISTIGVRTALYGILTLWGLQAGAKIVTDTQHGRQILPIQSVWGWISNPASFERFRRHPFKQTEVKLIMFAMAILLLRKTISK